MQENETALDWSVQGVKGDKGDPGLPGAKGDPGPPGTFTGTFTSPNQDYSLTVTDNGIELLGPSSLVRLGATSLDLISDVPVFDRKRFYDRHQGLLHAHPQGLDRKHQLTLGDATMTHRFSLCLIAFVWSMSVQAGPKDDALATYDKFFTSFTTGNQMQVAALFAPDAMFYGTNSPKL